MGDMYITSPGIQFIIHIDGTEIIYSCSKFTHTSKPLYHNTLWNAIFSWYTLIPLYNLPLSITSHWRSLISRTTHCSMHSILKHIWISYKPPTVNLSSAQSHTVMVEVDVPEDVVLSARLFNCQVCGMSATITTMTWMPLFYVRTMLDEITAATIRKAHSKFF